MQLPESPKVLIFDCQHYDPAKIERIIGGAMDELGVRPAITYLEDVTHAHMAATGHGEEHAAEGEGGAVVRESAPDCRRSGV